VLEAAVEELAASGKSSTALGQLFDLSQLKYQERDVVMETLRSFRKQVGAHTRPVRNVMQHSAL
jgi:hypothetical protein